MSEFNMDRDCNGVPIRAERVFDSCSDKDCLAGLPVTLTGGTLPPEVSIVRSRSAAVDNITISVEPVPFNKGFYSIDITYSFTLEILAYESSRSVPVVMEGTAFATKNCILYGSESSVKTFTDSPEPPAVPAESGSCCGNLPHANVSVLEPIVLETRIGRGCQPDDVPGDRNVYVTLGLFSVTELTRPVTLMVPTLDYTIPRKQCTCDSDSPCEVFEKLKFPEEEFSPASLCNDESDCAGLDEVMS